MPVVQRAHGRTVGALAAAVTSTMGATLRHLQGASGRQDRPAAAPSSPPPAYSPGESPPPYTANPVGGAGAVDPPGYTEVPQGAFNPRELTEFQLDELVHQIIGRITRHIRTELRMDRERIGRLRDTRR
ncbi:hypothetical protein [Streptomyces crystallinus]|uniref:Extensin n=1 Tax=Streptomyces crystallinus TaxID=68191 RepID=A0ABP3QF20_9ACTN